MAALLALPIFFLILLAVVALVVLLWIFLINVFFGWTLIGWVVALVWALQDRPRFASR